MDIGTYSVKQTQAYNTVLNGGRGHEYGAIDRRKEIVPAASFRRHHVVSMKFFFRTTLEFTSTWIWRCDEEVGAL